ncbi:hypothetical protein EMCG_08036 [[Emmonsia] crescens]|uniref:Uncharacterized protein n=1 Tax=[Emmonsia] crescens TaxID=73230 RepID=A0A0G2I7N5_9EURO|nr:hypothetical protein EMCG_08036 [Emmonsia crescens UAMH 3008]
MLGEAEIPLADKPLTPEATGPQVDDVGQKVLDGLKSCRLRPPASAWPQTVRIEYQLEDGIVKNYFMKASDTLGAAKTSQLRTIANTSSQERELVE